MKTANHISPQETTQPLSFGKSILAFGIPTLIGALGVYVLLPTLANAGVPLIWNYMISVVGMFPFLLILALLGLRLEVGEHSWKQMKSRFRIFPLSKRDWLWTTGLIFVFVGGQLILLPTGRWLVSILKIPLPEGLPPALDPLVDKTSIPVEFFGIPLRGSWEIALLYLIILFLNVIGEEFWWRGYILPRQELVHGEKAWLIHGILWTFFHAPFWWNLISLLPSTLSLSFVVSRLKNTTPGILVHFVMNGLGFVIVLLGILGLGA